MKPLGCVHRAIAGLLVVMLALPAVSGAATVTWDANGTTGGVTDGAGNWLDTNQWWNGTSNVTWTSGDDAVFGVGGTGGTVTLSATTAAGSLAFNSFSGTYTLGTSGTTLTLGSGGSTMNAGAGAVTLASPVTLSAAQQWTNNSSSLFTASGAITNGGNLLTVAGSGSTTLAAAISGAGGLTKNGSGTLLVSASNTFTGAVAINAGTLRTGSTGALGATSGTTTVNTGGTLDINGIGLGSEPVVLAGGTLVNNGASQSSAITGTGSLLVTANSTIGGSGEWRVNGASARLTVNEGVRLTKVDSNTVYLGVSGTVANNGEIVIESGQLWMSGVATTGTGSITVKSDNTRILVVTGGSTNSLPVTLSGGRLSLVTGHQSGALTLVASTTSSIRAESQNIISGNLLGSGRLDILRFGGTSTTLSGSNSGFTGTLSFSNAASSLLLASANAASGSAAFILSGTNGGSFAVANTVSGFVTHRLGSLSGTAGRLDNFAAGSSVTYVIGGLNTSASYTGLIQNTSGTTAVTKVGTGRLTLSAANTYAGSTTISAGTLALGASGSFANSPTITVGDATSSGAVLDLTAKAGLFSLGSGQTLGGGGTVLLASSGTFAVPGTFSPGNSPGLFTYDGGTTLLSGTTVMEILGTTRATGPSHGTGFYDAVNVIDGGLLDFTGGTLRLTFSTEFANNTAFDLFSTFDTASLAGSFANVDVAGSFYTGLNWSQTSGVWKSSQTGGGQSLEFNSATGSLVIVPEPGALAMTGIGIASAAWAFTRRRRQAS